MPEMRTPLKLERGVIPTEKAGIGNARGGDIEESSMTACWTRRASRDHAACLRWCKQADAMQRLIGVAILQTPERSSYRFRLARRFIASIPMPPRASSETVAGSGMTFGSGAYCGGGAEPSRLRFDAY